MGSPPKKSKTPWLRMLLFFLLGLAAGGAAASIIWALTVHKSTESTAATKAAEPEKGILALNITNHSYIEEKWVPPPFIQPTIVPKFPDRVLELPGAPADIGKIFSGRIPVWPQCDARLFYIFTEVDGGTTPDTPTLIWINGGPGASSLIGYFMENVGPFTINPDSTLEVNPNSFTKKYNLLIIDNPVGTGFSNTTLSEQSCYARSLEQVAELFYIGVKQFFTDLHPEYATNPLWLTGESFAAMYLAFIAEVFHNKGLPFVGIVVGNPVMDIKSAVTTVGEAAYGFGLVDEHGKEKIEHKAKECQEIAAVPWNEMTADQVQVLYKACNRINSYAYYHIAEGAFSFDVRYFYDVETAYKTALTGYLSRPEVLRALHLEPTDVWSTSDEGPEGMALMSNFGRNATGLFGLLLEWRYDIVIYNGNMDGSVGNHRANALAIASFPWQGIETYLHNTTQIPWRIDEEELLGWSRVYENLAFVILANAGHLVGISQPEKLRTVLDASVSGTIFSRTSQAPYHWGQQYYDLGEIP